MDVALVFKRDLRRRVGEIDPGDEDVAVPDLPIEVGHRQSGIDEEKPESGLAGRLRPRTDPIERTAGTRDPTTAGRRCDPMRELFTGAQRRALGDEVVAGDDELAQGEERREIDPRLRGGRDGKALTLDGGPIRQLVADETGDLRRSTRCGDAHMHRRIQSEWEGDAQEKGCRRVAEREIQRAMLSVRTAPLDQAIRTCGKPCTAERAGQVAAAQARSRESLPECVADEERAAGEGGR
ncbi:hypothetical protein LLS1_21200 [Leifsonia sp. LS1]|nr:hypothetical protein LLS1_21200 [Leifsonia sp. LS1]